VSHDPATDTYWGTFDGAAIAPSIAVVETVAAALDTDPTSLNPLYDVVDPGALDGLYSGATADGDRTAPTVEFTYHGHRVTVTGPGTVEVRPLDDV